MSDQISAILNDFSVYRNGTEYLGAADVELPDLESMTETISAAGVAGEVDIPILGHYSSMTVTINWRVLEDANYTLAKPASHHLDFRGSIQRVDKATGTLIQVPVKVTVRGIPKTTSLGSLAKGATMDNSNELEVVYLKIMHDGKTKVEIDKFNYVCVIDGVDYMAPIRTNLGI
ncbi:phage major tail tube protein [Brevibacillus panacihumi]|uniref:Phage tail protein n=1 Tax=Brevibacillus panacihumi TaxID=497735 RepID=A0A3M8CBF7_9BACL|nr:phage major tail tube protein [Brevibacillus panacihumi]RNB72175.1 phage tail protein [Brevibacillus panacihumi]